MSTTTVEESIIYDEFISVREKKTILRHQHSVADRLDVGMRRMDIPTADGERGEDWVFPNHSPILHSVSDNDQRPAAVNVKTDANVW